MVRVLLKLRLGPLGRNVGEVLGVFASLDLKPGKNQFVSSADQYNLQKLERSLMGLWSPLWSEAVDQADFPLWIQRKSKKDLKYIKIIIAILVITVLIAPSPQRRVIAQFTSHGRLGTDPQMMNNAASYCGPSGHFTNDEVGMCADDPNQIPAAEALKYTVSNVLKTGDPDKNTIDNMIDRLMLFITSSRSNPIKNTKRHVDLKVVNKRNIMAYKGRPLNGIWATAPYLHNGSVPNLYELFLPSCRSAKESDGDKPKECRSKTFTLGSIEYDPIKVGFIQKNQQDYSGLTIFDTSLPGNLNTGHEYAAGIMPVIVKDHSGEIQEKLLPPMSEKQRWALVEYLKSL